MQIEIFDVEHGQCAVVHCPNGKKLMIDAGHNSSRPWRPSVHFRGQPIENLVISNFDEDHASDVEGVMGQCGVRVINTNLSITSSVLHAMKAESGMGPGIAHLYNWLRSIEGRSGGLATADLGGIQTACYWSNYPVFTDANNLSVATFVTCDFFTILFPGDLAVAGWMKLLENQNFRQALGQVTVLVASHHGRENGCCEEVFRYLSPKAIIISDAGLEHATQETVNWYAGRCQGCVTRSQQNRKVFTTRSDGKITIDVDTYNRQWFIGTG